jgi:hypothetical protein
LSRHFLGVARMFVDRCKTLLAADWLFFCGADWAWEAWWARPSGSTPAYSTEFTMPSSAG